MAIAVMVSPGMPKRSAGIHPPASAALLLAPASTSPSGWPVPKSFGVLEKRFESEKTEGRYRVFTEIARDTLEGLRMQYPASHVETHVQEDMVAQGDSRLLRILLENLIGNAWKFTTRRDDPVIEIGKREGSGIFFVRDNGAGFDMAYAGKLFGAFQRLHTESDFPGTGIGLATVRRIVQRHQGRVWVESEPGNGATFYFLLSEEPPPSWLAGN